jgi:hypothetical protein
MRGLPDANALMLPADSANGARGEVLCIRYSHQTRCNLTRRLHAS